MASDLCFSLACCVLAIVIGPPAGGKRSSPPTLLLELDNKNNPTQKCQWRLGLSLTETSLVFHPVFWATELCFPPGKSTHTHTHTHTHTTVTVKVNDSLSPRGVLSSFPFPCILVCVCGLFWSVDVNDGQTSCHGHFCSSRRPLLFDGGSDGTGCQMLIQQD